LGDKFPGQVYAVSVSQGGFDGCRCITFVGYQQVRQFVMDLQAVSALKPTNTQHLLLEVATGLVGFKYLPVSASNDSGFITTTTGTTE